MPNHGQFCESIFPKVRSVANAARIARERICIFRLKVEWDKMLSRTTEHPVPLQP